MNISVLFCSLLIFSYAIPLPKKKKKFIAVTLIFNTEVMSARNNSWSSLFVGLLILSSATNATLWSTMVCNTGCGSMAFVCYVSFGRYLIDTPLKTFVLGNNDYVRNSGCKAAFLDCKKFCLDEMVTLA